jgi:solute carrier family 35 (UDP-galactose transporter), member B1
MELTVLGKYIQLKEQSQFPTTAELLEEPSNSSDTREQQDELSVTLPTLPNPHSVNSSRSNNNKMGRFPVSEESEALFMMIEDTSDSSSSGCYQRVERGLIIDDDSLSSHGTTSSHSSLEEGLLDEKTKTGPLLLPETQQQQRYRCYKLLFGTAGVYAAYLSYGMVQEDLYRYRSDIDGSAFQYVWFLQVLESTASIGLGLAGRKICGGRNDLRLAPFLLSGTSQVFAKVFMSLSLVAGASFPVATLAKSAKIVPVMIGQLLLGGSKYGPRDYLFATLIVVGTVMLSLGGNHKSSSGGDSFAGVAFILLSLVMDGCTGGLQKQLQRDMAATPPTTYDFVLYSHLSMVTVALVISVLTGDLWKGAACLAGDAKILQMVLTVCLLSVVGQSFIFYVIANFDPLVCATITTTRKMWSVLLSIAFKGHHLKAEGYGGLALALTGLLVEIQGKVPSSGSGSKRQVEKEHQILLPKTSMDHVTS